MSPVTWERASFTFLRLEVREFWSAGIENLLCLDFWISVLRTLPWLIVTPQGKAVDADQLTDDEWRISSRKALKGFTRLDARYFIPFFTRKFTRQVRKNNVISFEPRPYSRVLGTVMSVLLIIGLSINGCSYSKTSLTKENTIDQSRSLGCGVVSGLARFRRSLLFSSSIRETAHPPHPYPMFLTDLWLKAKNMD